jgi:hypothetical protein
MIKLSEFPRLNNIQGTTMIPIIDSGSNYITPLSNISALYPIVSRYSVPGDSIVTGTPFVDETLFITLTSGTNILTLRLPDTTNSRVGQIKTFITSNLLLTMSVSVVGGGSILGNALTTAFQYEAYSYQCISTELSGSWLRLA